jgi:predicted nucleotidyltransferase
MKPFIEKDFRIFKEATEVLDNLHIEYVVFGGIAVWAYGRKRQTKDIDLLIDPAGANKALIALLKAGWTTTRTDESWLFQARKEGVLVDLIFQAKGDFVLTEEIFKRAVTLNIEGYKFRVISPEDLIMVKVYALKEIRPADWYDAISVLVAVKDLDWNYIVRKASKNPKKVLSFLLFAQTEVPPYYVPDWAIGRLMDIVLPQAA